MPLDAKLKHHLQTQLQSGATASATSGGRAAGRSARPAGGPLIDDAERLLARVHHLIARGVVAAAMDIDAIELACYAMQLPLRMPRPTGTTKMGLVPLLDRAEQASELLVSTVASAAPEALLDRTARLLHETPQRNPMIEEARLLADATNLDDFGIGGLCRSAMLLAGGGGGLAQLAEAVAKQDAYGYWDARLKDGFHFEIARQMARERHAHARTAVAQLLTELQEDRL